MKRRVHIVWQLTRFERAAALAVLFALAVAVPVLAAYLGPDRSYTYTETELEKVRDESKDQWTLTNDNPPFPFVDTCISNSSCDAIPNITWQQNNCGWIADNASCELGYTWAETIIVKTGTHPAATVSRSVTCGVNGANGWCLNSATLTITGNEPLAGENITGIEGELDGTPFFCGGNTCAVPAPNGQSDAEFWALSSWGDSSRKGSATLKLDLDLPTLDGLVSGTPGNGGWYVSSVTLTADASDATSGLDFAQVRVDGGGWMNNSATLSTDGQYSVEFRAQDLAGQSVSVPASDVWVDATPPDVSLTPSGTAGLAGWYVSDVDVTLTASDATSGLSASQLQVNGDGWQAVGGVTLGEGVYTVDGEALDVAGNYNATSLDVKVDTTAPALSVTESGTAGNGGWYTSASVAVNAAATDATSGVADIQMQTDAAGYASATSQTVSGEGVHSVDTIASDAAGNSSSDSRTIRIDSVSPTLSLTSHNTSSVPDESGWVTVTGAVSDATSGPSSVQFSSDGGGSWDTVAVDGGGSFDIGWDSTSVRNGEVTLRVRPVDEAGNVGGVTSFTIYVKNDKPYVSLPAGCVAAWDAYAIDAGGGSNPLDGLSVTVSDPENRWPARDYSFSGVPESWSWDRQFGDGTAAPPGEYDVTVTARDTVGNTTARTGCIQIPDPDAAAAGTTTQTETTDPLDEDDSPIGGTPPDTTGDAPTSPTLPSLQKAMANPTGAPVTTKITAPESGAQQAEAARLALATAANAPAGGDAALFLAAAATAYVLSRKQEREEEEAARLTDLAMRAERRAMERQAGKVLAADLTDEQVMAQVIAAGGDPNMSIEQARAITHNSRIGNAIRAAELAYEAWLAEQNKSQTGPPPKTYLTDDEWEAQHMPGASERSLAEFYEQQLAAANANSHIQLDDFWEAARALPPASGSIQLTRGQQADAARYEAMAAAARAQALAEAAGWLNEQLSQTDGWDTEGRAAIYRECEQKKAGILAGTVAMSYGDWVRPEDEPSALHRWFAGAAEFVRAGVDRVQEMAHQIGVVLQSYSFEIAAAAGVTTFLTTLPMNPIAAPFAAAAAFATTWAVLSGGQVHGDNPDYRGIRIAESYMNPEEDDIRVAAAIAVQSQWYNPIMDSRGSPFSGDSSGLGIAQVADFQMVEYGLEGQDQMDPEVAIEAMMMRMDRMVSICESCGPRDQLVISALAQNGSWLDEENLRSFIRRHMDARGFIDWEGVFNDPYFSFTLKGSMNKPFGYLDDFRAGDHVNFDTRFMIKLYLQNLRELQLRGWDLPPGISESDLIYMEELANSLPPD